MSDGSRRSQWRVDPHATYEVAQLVGPGSINETDRRWNVYGADLGHMFQADSRMYVTFGDTFGGPPAYPFFSMDHTGHRCNTMAWVEPLPTVPTDGLRFAGMVSDARGEAAELIPAEPGEAGVIPTYGTSLGSRMFLHYMSVRHWAEPGHWSLDHAGIAYSDDGGRQWTRVAMWPGTSNFGQVSLVRHASRIYVFGIPGGRYGPLQLARVHEARLLDATAYEYWNGTSWARDRAEVAVDVVPAPVGELSVQWSSYYGTWLMAYLDDPAGEIVLRTSPSLPGPWSAPLAVVSSARYPQLYAPYLTPLWNDGPDIFFTMSVFDRYQVYLMHTSLQHASPLPATA